MGSDLVVLAGVAESRASVPSVGLPHTTIERLRQARELIAAGSAEDVVDVLLYADAIVALAREKRAASVAREAARTRIEAARHLGLLLSRLPAHERENLEEIIPSRFSLGCDDLASIPTRLFKRVIEDMLARDTACSIRGVMRSARLASLKPIEPDIYQAFDGSIWISAGGRARVHIHHGGIDEARRRLGLKSNPKLTQLQHEFADARIRAQALSHLQNRLSGEPRRLVGEAELQQMKVASLLDQAVKAMVAQ